MTEILRSAVGECVLKSTMLNKQGYARIWVKNAAGRWRMFYMHRHAWEQVHGPIPFGMTIDHLCEVPNCYNVDHLELVTLSENVRRKQVRKNQTHCLRGHEFTPDNLVAGTRWKACKACHRIRQAAYKKPRGI